MDSERPNNEGRDISILVLGVGLGVLPWLLDKVRVEMPQLLAMAFLFLSVVLIIGALIHLGWLKKLPYLSLNVSIGTELSQASLERESGQIALPCPNQGRLRLLKKQRGAVRPEANPS
jgi:hypothetical protein